MTPLLEKAVQELENRMPLALKAVYPRRILPPTGYPNPKYLSCILAYDLIAWTHPELRMLPHVTSALNALMQIKYSVPTYFLDLEFAQAVGQTEPPTDFKLEEIKWPLPAMTIVLPSQFAIKYF